MATELGQCPHRVGTDEWKTWQRHFISAQTSDVTRLAEAEARAHERLEKAGLRLGTTPPGSIRWTYSPDPRPTATTTHWVHTPFGATQILIDGKAAEEAADRVIARWAQLVSAPWPGIQMVMHGAADAFSALHDAIGTWDDGDPPPEVNVIAGRPAGKVKRCHHGNAKGKCRECSGVGRRH
jgi:hypothetical protein